MTIITRALAAGLAVTLGLCAPAGAQLSEPPKDERVYTECTAPLACTHEVEADAPIMRAGVSVDTGVGGVIPRFPSVRGITEVRRTTRFAAPAGTSTYRAVVDVSEVAAQSGGFPRPVMRLRLKVGGDGQSGDTHRIELSEPGRYVLERPLTIEAPAEVPVTVQLDVLVEVPAGDRRPIVCRPPLRPPFDVPFCVESPVVIPLPARGTASARLAASVAEVVMEHGR
jgi:hypothetical protein